MIPLVRSDLSVGFRRKRLGKRPTMGSIIDCSSSTVTVRSVLTNTWSEKVLMVLDNLCHDSRAKPNSLGNPHTAYLNPKLYDFDGVISRSFRLS